MPGLLLDLAGDAAQPAREVALERAFDEKALLARMGGGAAE